MLKKILFFACFSFAAHSAQSEETCASMGVVATNYSSAAYQLAAEHTDAIDKMGFFDTYMMYLSLLFERSEKEGTHSREFFMAAKIAGASIKGEKAQLTEKLSSKGYEALFPRMVVRSCEIVRANPKP